MDLPLAGCRGRPSFLEQGIYIRQAVAFVPGAWQYLDAITIRVSPMTPAEAFHPNVLDYEDTEDGAAEPTDDTEYGPGWHAGLRARGRHRRHRRHHRLCISSLLFHHDGSTTATAKPKTRKLGSYFSVCSFSFLCAWNNIMGDRICCSCRGDPELIELSSQRSDRARIRGQNSHQ